MIERYQNEIMREVWNEQNKFEAWLKVELYNCDALHAMGLVTSDEIEKLQKATFDIDRIKAIELETRHDVVAFTRCVSESLGEESKWIHYGLTSTDVVDTAYGYVYTKVNAILKERLDTLVLTIEKLALEHKHTIMMGRTHGIHAELTTFGFKMLVYLSEFRRHQERFANACREIEVGKISGAVGTYANVDPFVEGFVCDKLGIDTALISTQTLQRDRHANYLSVVALIGDSLDKLATEIRHLQRTEVGEVCESFAKGQKGSSAMPHKKNPITCENVSGLSRCLRGYMVAAHENVALWHERDISHSSCERIIMPDATSLLEFMLVKMDLILSNAQVNKERMLKNIEITNNVFFAQRVLTSLIQKGLTREEAYDLVQPVALYCLENHLDFSNEIVAHVNQYLNQEELDTCFIKDYHLPLIDGVYKKFGY